jgi:hypothetical protein
MRWMVGTESPASSASFRWSAPSDDSAARVEVIIASASLFDVQA